MPTVAFDRSNDRRRAIAQPPAIPFLLIVAALFAVSGGVLWTIGINYDGLTGSPISKIHPATCGTCLLIVWQMARSGDPAAYSTAVARRWPATLTFLAASLILFVSIVISGGHNMSGTIDTFVLPGALVIVTTSLDPETRRQTEALIHAIMIVNAIMALVEFAIGMRFFPFVVDGVAFATDARSTALGGHPLVNATFTACYVLVLVSGGGVLLRARTRALVVLLSLAAMVTFGGRSAIVVAVVLGAIGLVRRFVGFMRHGRVSLVTAAALLLAIPSLLGAGGILAATGFFTPLLDRFQSDGGSAEARLRMFDLVGQVNGHDLLIGPDPAYIDAIRLTEGLEQGIENPIVDFLLYHGAIITLMMLLSFGAFTWEVVHRAGRGSFLPLLGFLLLINTFESLAGKTVLLAKFILMIVVFYPPRHVAAAASTGRAMRSVARRGAAVGTLP